MWAPGSRHPEVRGLTWFDYAKETDWRIDSSEASLAAWGAGAGSSSCRTHPHARPAQRAVRRRRGCDGP